MSIQGLEVTEVHIQPVKNGVEGNPLQAFARVVLNGQFRINSIRVIRGKFGPFISFPNEYNKKEGKAYPFCHPITKALQDYLSERILRQWEAQAA